MIFTLEGILQVLLVFSTVSLLMGLFYYLDKKFSRDANGADQDG